MESILSFIRPTGSRVYVREIVSQYTVNAQLSGQNSDIALLERAAIAENNTGISRRNSMMFLEKRYGAITGRITPSSPEKFEYSNVNASSAKLACVR